MQAVDAKKPAQLLQTLRVKGNLQLKLRIVYILILFVVSTNVYPDGRKAWLYNEVESNDYVVRLKWISPFPGTPVFVGDKVKFKVLGFYKNNLNESGIATLVIQDEKDNLLYGLGRDEIQESISVSGRTGEFELKQIFEVPSGINYLRIFIPFKPEGIDESIGQIAVTYPVIARE